MRIAHLAMGYADHSPGDLMNQELKDVVVYFNNKFVPLSEAKVGILTHALNYGTGVFEGIRGFWESLREELFIVRPEYHYRRWTGNCKIMLIDLPLEASELVDLTVELIRRNKFQTNLIAAGLLRSINLWQDGSCPSPDNAGQENYAH